MCVGVGGCDQVHKEILGVCLCENYAGSNVLSPCGHQFKKVSLTELMKLNRSLNTKLYKLEATFMVSDGFVLRTASAAVPESSVPPFGANEAVRDSVPAALRSAG